MSTTRKKLKTFYLVNFGAIRNASSCALGTASGGKCRLNLSQSRLYSLVHVFGKRPSEKLQYNL